MEGAAEFETAQPGRRSTSKASQPASRSPHPAQPARLSSRSGCSAARRPEAGLPGVGSPPLSALEAAAMFASAGLSPGQTCGLVLIFAVLVQSICVAITFLYFTNELQQLRETYSKSSFACFTRDNFFLEDLDPSYNEDSDPCWQVKWQLSRLIKKMISKNYVEKTAATAKGGKLRGPTTAEREAVENSVPRVAAHLTANRRSALVRQSKRRRYLAQGGEKWQRSGELVTCQCSLTQGLTTPALTDCAHLRLMGTSSPLIDLMIIVPLTEIAGNAECLSLRRRGEKACFSSFSVGFSTLPQKAYITTHICLLVLIANLETPKKTQCMIWSRRQVSF
ncbi:tumor necrosis factor ligand superfamily member 10 isoform X2 [Paroedura picta]|uniref:tumor necrosis factor ligand superfamily member 10 isoform X2 n=1 Tax=Paroedura picta TaxID=143630 RepID=UPI0040565806